MSQIFEDCARPLFVRCEDVGLNCDGIIYGKNRETVTDLTIMHMFEYHAICPEEMTTCTRLKIRENIHLYRDLVRAQMLHEFSDISEELLPIV